MRPIFRAEIITISITEVSAFFNEADIAPDTKTILRINRAISTVINEALERIQI